MSVIRWHVDRWPALAWLETGIKLFAVGIAVFAVVRGGESASTWRVGSLVALGVLAVLAGVLAVTVWDRFRNREIIAMAFVFLNNLGHWSALVHLLSVRSVTPPLATFAALMLVGDVVKIGFIRKTGFTVRGVSSRALIGLTLVYVLGYAAIFGLSAV